METIFRIDAFADQRFTGNPAGVVILGFWRDDALLQRVAFENNYSETAFLVPASGDDWEIRWFTPTAEVGLCGHATLAAAHAVFSHTGSEAKQVTFHADEAGTLTVKRELFDRYQLRFPSVEPRELPITEAAVEALGVRPLELYEGRYSPEEHDLMAVLESEAAVRALEPDGPALASLKSRGVIFTAPAEGEDADFVSRCFYPNVGIYEDPATGSAHCLMTPYWSERLRGRYSLKARQLSTRGGWLECRHEGPRVLISGRVVGYLDGALYLD
ncbi:MAG: PhzF family phenazine biosynthesis protein [Acidobacteriota bacterium]